MKTLRLNPVFWSVTEARKGSLVVTHEPQKFKNADAAELLLLQRKGLALVVELSDTSTDEVAEDETAEEPETTDADE